MLDVILGEKLTQSNTKKEEKEEKKVEKVAEKKLEKVEEKKAEIAAVGEVMISHSSGEI